jgi:cytochrome c oxidase subunit IV
MKNIASHITGYSVYAVVLVVLLLLTTLSVVITGIHLGAITVGLALLIAIIKVGTVISYFMHLRSESRFLKLAVAGVFTLYGLVVVITFIDYLFR